MKRIRNTILLLVAATVATACGGARKAQTTAADTPLVPQKEQVWQLVRQQGRPLPARSATITLTVNPEAGTAGGQSACNTYSYSCALGHPACTPDGDWYDIRLVPIGSGSVECTEAEMNAEARYLATLGRATRMKLTATALTLYQKDKEILHYELQ